ncbi:hypothetical protein SLEP1_g25762 [Rubroshorea leprosula]|uniref:RRM domain-containing protein n=1 Tax=Rubroshorea leprosula TaxID=152421 RepID=A0AAV5JJU7_9ROSI|nr:hypothetical protein SLEP1_g25762 [Rubroshorea leprosula]
MRERGRERERASGYRSRAGRSSQGNEKERHRGRSQQRKISSGGKRRTTIDYVQDKKSQFGGAYNKGLYNQATPFFFTNFPEEWSYAEMWRTFSQFGRVYAVYSPRRRNRNGNRFGFVRFLDVKDKKELERKLDQIWVGDRKLWVNIPRFDALQKKEMERRNPQGEDLRIPLNTCPNIQGRSFADVVKGSRGIDSRMVWQEKGPGENWQGMEYKVNVEDSTWLEGTYVGSVHSVEMVKNLQEKFFMEGYFHYRIRAMGGNLVLLDCEDKEELKDLVDMASEWLGQWFEEDVDGEWQSVDEPGGAEGGEEDVVRCTGETNGKFQLQDPQDGDRTVDAVPNKARSRNPKEKEDEAKIMQTCISVGSIGVEEAVQEQGAGSSEQAANGGQILPDFIASPNGEIAGESIGHSGIQNCNRSIKRKMQRKLAKEIWELAKHLGATAECDEEVICKLTKWRKEIAKPKLTWRKRKQEEEVIEGDHFIGVFGTWGEERVPVHTLNIYSPCDLPGKRALWVELQNLISNRNGNWCLGGDFNAVRSSGERAGCNGMSREMKDFDSFIIESGLVDLPMVGRKYTWYNANGQHMSRIDRFLVSEEWLLRWCDVKQWGLKRTVSYHCPILLKNEWVDWGPKPFKFFDAWLQDPGCKELIRKTWNSSAVEGWYGFKLKEKLKSTKKALKEWSRNAASEVDRKIIEAESEIAHLDERGENVQLLPTEIEKRRSSFLELWKNLKLKENMWQQKSRLMWLKEGDANTKFFHRCVKGRWRKNEINSIQINGEQHKGVGEIKEKMASYFEQLFTEDRWQRPKLEVLDKVIGEQQMAFIEGRQLVDGVVIANEVIDEAKRKKKRSFLLKVDFEKAYDNVCWDFLDYMLMRMGFYKTWRMWIHECLQSSMVSVLVNGSPSRQFPVSKGLHQGDPLSPFLFLIVAEDLNGLMSSIVEKELYKGVTVGCFNLSLMGKWWGRLAVKEDGLWRKVIESKYSEGGGQWMDWVRNGAGACSSWWRDVRRINTAEGEISGWLTESFRLKVGEGKDVSFWWDEWCGEFCLANKFPRLYLLSAGKEKECCQMGTMCNGSWKWILTWRRKLLEREEEAAKELSTLIESVKISPGRLDEWEWMHSKESRYSSKTAYSLLTKVPRSLTQEKVFRRVWNPNLPSKISAFNWQLLLNRLPTKSNLLKRGLGVIMGDGNCNLCQEEEEDETHLFLKCKNVRWIWKECARLWGINIEIQEDCWKTFEHPGAWTKNTRVRKGWDCTWSAIVWSIWLMRNRRIFQNQEMDSGKLLDLVQIRSFLWFKAKNAWCYFTHSDWLSNPIACLTVNCGGKS